MDLDERIRDLVWIDEQVKRVRWSNEEIDTKFARRNAAHILEDGETFYMNPCADLTPGCLYTIKGI